VGVPARSQLSCITTRHTNQRGNGLPPVYPPMIGIHCDATQTSSSTCDDIIGHTARVDTDNLALVLQLLHKAGKEVGVGSLTANENKARPTRLILTWSELQYCGPSMSSHTVPYVPGPAPWFKPLACSSCSIASTWVAGSEHWSVCVRDNRAR
jgi:hypothetical protein